MMCLPHGETATLVTRPEWPLSVREVITTRYSAPGAGRFFGSNTELGSVLRLAPCYTTFVQRREVKSMSAPAPVSTLHTSLSRGENVTPINQTGPSDKL